MKNLFINEEDEIVIKFVVGEDTDGTIFCDLKKEEIVRILGEEGDIEEYEAVFRRPSFGDSVMLYDSMFSVETDGNDILKPNVNLNPILARYNKIMALIKRWNLTDGDKKPTEKQIKNLHPIIANTIGVALEEETGNMI